MHHSHRLGLKINLPTMDDLPVKMWLFSLLFSKFRTSGFSKSTAVPAGPFCKGLRPGVVFLHFAAVLLTCVSWTHFTDLHLCCPVIFRILLVASSLNIVCKPMNVAQMSFRKSCLIARPPSYFQFSVTRTPKCSPFPKCTCPSTPLPLCKPWFHFLEWPSLLGENVFILYAQYSFRVGCFP